MARGRNKCCSKKRRTSAHFRRMPRSRCRRKRRTRPRRRRRCRPMKQKPLPAFFLFMEDHRPLLRCEHPNWTAVQMAKKLGVAWHQQSCADKERYLKKAAKLRKKHHKIKRRSCGKKRKRKKKKRKLNKSRCRKLLAELECLACC